MTPDAAKLQHEHRQMTPDPKSGVTPDPTRHVWRTCPSRACRPTVGAASARPRVSDPMTATVADAIACSPRRRRGAAVALVAAAALFYALTLGLALGAASGRPSAPELPADAGVGALRHTIMPDRGKVAPLHARTAVSHPAGGAGVGALQIMHACGVPSARSCTSTPPRPTPSPGAAAARA